MTEGKKETMYTVIAKDNSWFAKVDRNGLDVLLEENAVLLKDGTPNSYQMVYNETELYDYIKEREGNKCYNCENNKPKIRWITSQENGGFETPINLIYSCLDCFEKWKEDDVQKGQLKERNRSLYIKPKEISIECITCKKHISKEELKYINSDYSRGICNHCYDKENDQTYILINEKNELIEIKERHLVKQLWESGKIEYLNQKVAKVFDEPKKKQCVVCKKLKWLNSYRKKVNDEKMDICKKCQKERQTEGLVSVLDEKGEHKLYISTDEMKKLIKKEIGEMVNSYTYKFNKSVDFLLFLSIKKYYRYIKKESHFFAVAISGKWSADINKETKDELIESGLAEEMNEEVIRLTYDIEKFKNDIMIRDKGICKFCAGKGTGVYSENRIRTYKNSYCTCLDCEYKHIPNKLLKWLNLNEETKTIHSKTKAKNIWLTDKEQEKKFLIDKHKAEILIEEGMAEYISKEIVRLLFEPKEFRNYVFGKTNSKCYYCGEIGNTIDHVIPRSKGGLTTPKNCVCACEDCNNKKGSLNKKLFKEIMNYEEKK